MAADLRLRHTTVSTPFGLLTVVVSTDGVVATSGGDPRELVDELARRLGAVSRSAALRAATRDLEAYFGGRRAPMRTPADLRLVGTPFARAVLGVTRTIPYGELWTYGDVAAKAGRPGAARAAGSALARSPIPLARAPADGGQPIQGTAHYVPAPGTAVASSPTLTSPSKGRGVYQLEHVTFPSTGVWTASLSFTEGGQPQTLTTQFGVSDK